MHTFLPIRNCLLLAKRFSASSESTEYSTMSDLIDRIQLQDNTGFVISVYDSSWWLWCETSVDENTNEVKITFVHPHGPSRSFIYPLCPDIPNIPRTAVLIKGDPRTAMGCVLIHWLMLRPSQSVISLNSEWPTEVAV
jgi:hypothetical protein